MPHMLFYGPPGTGKTTCALAICRQLYGPDLFKSRVLELNASDERGISVVRNKIKGFASTAVGQAVPGYPCPPYKILILDEADSMTTDAQSALRRTMETHSKVTRFFILCNYVSRIIEPIASRCAKFRFKPLGSEVMSDRLKHIAEREGLTLGEGVYDAAAKHSGGDMRKAITLLQSSARLFGAKELTGEDIIAVAGAIAEDDVAELLDLCGKNAFDRAIGKLDVMLRDGFPGLQILTQFADAVTNSENCSDGVKARICLAAAEADKALIDGSDDSLQLGAVVSVACLAMSGK
jgi:replication factor C subunit 2/4